MPNCANFGSGIGKIYTDAFMHRENIYRCISASGQCVDKNALILVQKTIPNVF